MGLGSGLYMYDVVVEKFTFAISSPDELLLAFLFGIVCRYGYSCVYCISFYGHYCLLWFIVIKCAIWSTDHKVVINLSWVELRFMGSFRKASLTQTVNPAVPSKVNGEEGQTATLHLTAPARNHAQPLVIHVTTVWYVWATSTSSERPQQV